MESWPNEWSEAGFRTETRSFMDMRGVVELPPEPHGNLRSYFGYRLEVRECFSCWRDFHVYVPIGNSLGLAFTGVPCPHCHRWEAETLIPADSRPIYVSACQRTWLAWQARQVQRWRWRIWVYCRICASWPFWALYRLKLRWSKGGKAQS